MTSHRQRRLLLMGSVVAFLFIQFKKGLEIAFFPVHSEKGLETSHMNYLIGDDHSTSQASLSIPLSTNSTIASDISKIWHHPDKGSVCVHLKENARCPYPAFLGRLSGPALAMLDWSEEKDTAEPGTVLCGRYGDKWLDAGEYFIEILILYCEDFGVAAMKRVNNEAAWLEAGFATKCVEDATHNRITAKGSTINITVSTEGKGNYRLGRWVRRQGLPNRPLFTRYQPVACSDRKRSFKPPDPLPEWCKPLMYRDNPDTGTGTRMWKFEVGEETVGLPEYEFQWRMRITESELIERLRKRLHGTPNSLPKICAVGDSHSRLMIERSLPQLNLSGLLEFIQHYWIRPRKIAGKIRNRNCDKVFIQIGQWPPSWYTNGNPFSFGKYYSKMKEHVQNVLQMLESQGKANATIFLPSIDQGPLMGRVNDCGDWRTPTVLDGYSMANKLIERDLNTSRVRYIDINFIVFTHWDGHQDWVHLLEDVRYRKTMYLSALILGELEDSS